jgi:predicted nucleic acid-binding protein
MVATRALFDTNILIDYTHGIVEAELELSSYGIRGISIITWIEMLAGAKQNEEEATRRFLGRFELVPLTDDVADEAIRLRREARMKLPDAIILATAVAQDWLLVTRNTKDFREGRHIRIPYRLHP